MVGHHTKGVVEVGWHSKFILEGCARWRGAALGLNKHENSGSVIAVNGEHPSTQIAGDWRITWNLCNFSSCNSLPTLQNYYQIFYLLKMVIILIILQGSSTSLISWTIWWCRNDLREASEGYPGEYDYGCQLFSGSNLCEGYPGDNGSQLFQQQKNLCLVWREHPTTRIHNSCSALLLTKIRIKNHRSACAKIKQIKW